MMNQTSINCLSFFYKQDFYNVLLNILRISVFLLYFAWILIFIRFKELHSHQMVLMLNLSVMGIFYCLTGILAFFLTPCDQMSVNNCIILVILSLLRYYYASYSMSALSIHRLGTILVPNRTKMLKVFNICIVITVVWIIPLCLAIIQVCIFENKIYFDSKIADCVYDSSSDISGFMFFFVSGYIVPNLVIIAFDVYEIKKTKESMTAIGRNDYYRESLKTIIQLRVLFFMYQISCISNLFILYLSSYLLTQNQLMPLFDILRWLFHVSPIGLLYSHPILIKKYNKLWNIVKNRSSVGAFS
jgi:hypothetical protein